MPELVAEFEAGSATPVELVLSSTGNLAAQIENGAPADLFFSADRETVDRLVATGDLRAASARTYALGTLVLMWPAGRQPPADLRDLTQPRFAAISIANPEHAPYGAAAREALQASGLWAALESRIVFGENVGQAYQLVRTGNADAGLVAGSVLQDPASEPHLVIDSGLHAPIEHVAAVASGSVHPAAEEFLEFVLSDVGQGVLRRAGFAAGD